MIPFVLLACRPPEVDPSSGTPDPAGTATTAATADTAAPLPVPRPTLISPTEAVDLDPDPAVLQVALIAAVHGEGYAYNGQVPGPTLRARVGDTLIVDLTNDLQDPTTIHWHGVAVPYAMDGVTWQTEPIGPGATFRYQFTLPVAGTFWYHPHFDTERQVDLGLYGVLVVEDPADPVPDGELVVVLDATDEIGLAEADPHQVDPTATTLTVNGLADPVYPVAAGSSVRVRLVNASGAQAVQLLSVRQIASDQGLLPDPVEGDLLLAPGDRADLEWSIGASFDLLRQPYTVAGGPAFGDPVRLLSVEAQGAGSAPAPLPWPTAPTAPSPDPGTTDLRLLFSGSAGVGWEINGETFPDVTVPVVPLGHDTVVEIRNPSAAEHPFHLHGHAFEVLSVDGVAPDQRTVEDTLQVGIGQLVRLQFVADNPGAWMTHCHILPHAEDGMMTVIEVQ